MLNRLLPGLALCLWLLVSIASAQAPAASPEDGVRPTDVSGRALNFDFETGTLADWTATGAAFEKQPIKGDTVQSRRGDMRSRHTGDYWIGTYEVAGDKPQGTLTSVPFKVTHPFASFRVAGGPHRETVVELLASDGKVFYSVAGHETEDLESVAVDLRAMQGQEIRIRLVDRHSSGWGHINFDDFRFHAAKPNLPQRPQPTALDEYAHAGLSPEEAAKAMTLPEGFTARLFAGEPDVQQPIAMALDDRGRLWIAEAYSYPRRVPEAQARDRILIFEDTDGDGKHDTRKVFADKLNLVSGLEVGFGGVWVGAAPQFMFIPDRDGDDRPDGPPQVLLDGWGFQDTHETLNAFIWGPDGWLYGCHGVFTHSRVGKPGSPDNERMPLNCGIWRYHPTRHEFEVFCHGTSNPWGVDFNDKGAAFETACVIPHLFHMIQGARYHRQGGSHFNEHTYDDIKTIAVHRHFVGANPHAGNNRSDSAGGGHAHAGAMLYLGGKWPEKYRNQIFMNNIHGQRINMDRLDPRGSGYVGNAAPDFLLSNDRWSQILNLRYGPDGDVYMIDWYDKQACHLNDVNAHDRSNGRIFKVVYNGPDQPAWTKEPLPKDLTKLDDGELMNLLIHPNHYFVRHGLRLLQERAAKAEAPALKKMRNNILSCLNNYTGHSLHFFWALHVTGGLAPEHLEMARRHENPFVRAWSIQLDLDRDAKTQPRTRHDDGTRLTVSSETLTPMVKLAESDPSPVVRLYLASACTRLVPELRWELIEKLLQHSEDASDHNLPMMYWYAAEPLAPLDPARALKLAAATQVPNVQQYLFRRLASLGTPASRDVLVDHVLASGDADRRRTVLEGLSSALAGQRRVEMPKRWPEAASKLASSRDARLKSLASSLSVTFGDPAAFASLRKTLMDRKLAAEQRQAALAALSGAKDTELPPLLHTLINEEALRGPALRALGGYDHPQTPPLLLKAYAGYNAQDKRDALATLAARTSYAEALMAAVDAKQIPPSDLSADLVRQLQNLNSKVVEATLGRHWGIVRQSPQEKLKAIAQHKQMITAPRAPKPDISLGRAVFAKTCQQCHVMFAVGGKVGPELTGSNRANLDYLLSNILDPSAVMAKEYQPSVLALSDGRVITGIVRSNTGGVLTVQTANEVLLVPQKEVDQMEQSSKSMMPDDILKPLSPDEIRALAGYMASPSQVPILATADTVKNFFNGRDLTGWDGRSDLWSVENGEIVGRTTGLKNNEFLISQLLATNFKLSLEVKLVDNQGNSGIQFRSESLPGGEMKGYQADIGPGWWGKLYEEHGRALLWKDSGESHVKPGDWNTYEVEAVGTHVRTWINGQLCVDLEDTGGARRGVFGLQLHSGGPTEVRYRNLRLELK